MIFPKINNIYEYKNEQYILWQQDLFRTVYLRSCVNSGGSSYITFNWWKFMFSAKKIDKYIDNRK